MVTQTNGGIDDQRGRSIGTAKRSVQWHKGVISESAMGDKADEMTTAEGKGWSPGRNDSADVQA
jgi:hypothetical protein